MPLFGWRKLMIRVKGLVEKYNYKPHKAIDELINDFLEENPNIELIDIKYQSSASTESATYGYDTSALIIYRELAQ